MELTLPLCAFAVLQARARFQVQQIHITGSHSATRTQTLRLLLGGCIWRYVAACNLQMCCDLDAIHLVTLRFGRTELPARAQQVLCEIVVTHLLDRRLSWCSCRHLYWVIFAVYNIVFRLNPKS